jgi:hypothetical protein
MSHVARAGAPPTRADEVDRPGMTIAIAQGSAPRTVLRRLIEQAEIIPILGCSEGDKVLSSPGSGSMLGSWLSVRPI